MIQENIKSPLSEEILFGKLSKKGGKAYVRLENEKITISCEEIKEGESVN